MKVIFVEDVPNVGRIGQSKVVADGYARNYLFPRKLAVLADSQVAAAIDAQLKKKMKLRALEEAELAELAKQITGLEITLKAKVGENEKLYGSITTADIAEALSRAAGREIDKRKIELPEPIKQAGVSAVTIRLAHEITAAINVNVISEEAAAEKPEKKEEKVAAKAEKAEKKEKKEKKEQVSEEKPAEAAAGEKPPKEKKTKKAKAQKESAPEPAAAEVKPEKEEKKEKKPRAKAKKEPAAEEKKE
ncbi:MAG: 50S ribosomal protein L9 [Chloroflexi bacterium RBG_13_57_8]|nr:MAG: 50S ribosomal protein L9 [Chloroflexi bacterium RBG_13_57_8]